MVETSAEIIIEAHYVCKNHIPDAIKYYMAKGYPEETISVEPTNKPVDCSCGQPAKLKIEAKNMIDKKETGYKKPIIKRGFLILIALTVVILNGIDFFITSTTFKTPFINIVGLVSEIFLAEVLYIILKIVIVNSVTVTTRKERKQQEKLNSKGDEFEVWNSTNKTQKYAWWSE